MLRLLPVTLIALAPAVCGAADEPLPFSFKVETFREKETGVMVFAVRLEQPFLAEEFEKSNYLRIASSDDQSYLIYPKQTKFRQKHAEFYGRLRGDGAAKLQLSYEIVSENLDGSRHVDVREAIINVKIPANAGGPTSIYKEWARHQNSHFASLLEYYPDESFFQYVLLQSRNRYGVVPPKFRAPQTTGPIEDDLYYLFSGGLAVQQALQRQTLASGPQVGDLNIHISQLKAPQLRSLNYGRLLEEKAADGVEPQVHDMARLIPRNQYFLHFSSMKAANEITELSSLWGNNLLRLLTVTSREHNLREKLEDQLCLRRSELADLFDDGVIDEIAATGTDIFVAEGADLTLVFKLAKPDVFQAAAAQWLEDVADRHPELQRREFNYRGHRVAARFTSDRIVSSFVVAQGDYVVYSNSHRAIRTVIDTMIGAVPNLHEAQDYQYVTTLLPPSDDPQSAYLFASEEFLKRLTGPAFKVSEKRRLQCFNNLIMLNNASMFHRLEHGRSPGSLTDLVEGRFVDADKLVCPHGGAYAFDVERDTCTCSLHNRLKYLTPNAELEVLRVSSDEKQQYDRYRSRYESVWKRFFDPLAARITAGPTTRVELAVLPFANSGFYRDLRGWLDDRPHVLSSRREADSAIGSLHVVPGRQRLSETVRAIPGMREVLAADPTLTDLNWLGDGLSIHFCDDDTILEIDPIRLKPLTMLGNVPVLQQSLIATALTATNLPVYVSIDVEDARKADRLLENLAGRIFLEGGAVFGLATELDAYRLPDYKEHKIFVVSFQLYAVKMRLYVARVGERLVASTKPTALQGVIDAAEKPVDDNHGLEAHALIRWNHLALDEFRHDLEIYWAEKTRHACHRNIMPIYNLIKLYNADVGDVQKLSQSKYGVTYFCPDGGHYEYDSASDQVACTVHGNRRHARQGLRLNQDSSFAKFFNSIEDIQAFLRFQDDGLIATVEIVRAKDDD